MLKRIGICLITILCATSVFAQARRKTRSTATQTQPGYYFTINTCNACCYDWHESAVKLFKAAGIYAVVVFGQERKNSNTEAFASLRSFEKFFFKDVTRDSEICAQGTLYVGPFASEDSAISALEKFPSVLFSVIKNRGTDDMYSEAELRNLARAKVTQNGTSNNWTFGGDSFFSINGYQIVQSGRRSRNRSSAAPASARPTTVASDLLSQLGDDGPRDLTLDKLTIVDGYALQNWSTEHTGGQALLRFSPSSGTWVLVNMGGGAWEVDTLVSMSVPRTIASLL